MTEDQPDVDAHLKCQHLVGAGGSRLLNKGQLGLYRKTLLQPPPTTKG